MSTRNTLMLRVMRFLVERMLTTATAWEDRQRADGGPGDYRLARVNSGLHQASQELRDILDGVYRPGHQVNYVMSKPWKVKATPTERYLGELLGDEPVPLRPVN